VVDQDNKREDEWFLRNEKQLLDAARTARLEREQERAAKEKAEETRRLKDLHLMARLLPQARQDLMRPCRT